MEDKCCSEGPKKKGFFGRLFEKMDKKLEEKSKQSCCGGEDENKGSGSTCCN